MVLILSNKTKNRQRSGISHDNGKGSNDKSSIRKLDRFHQPQHPDVATLSSISASSPSGSGQLSSVVAAVRNPQMSPSENASSVFHLNNLWSSLPGYTDYLLQQQFEKLFFFGLLGFLVLLFGAHVVVLRRKREARQLPSTRQQLRDAQRKILQLEEELRDVELQWKLQLETGRNPEETLPLTNLGLRDMAAEDYWERGRHQLTTQVGQLQADLEEKTSQLETLQLSQYLKEKNGEKEETKMDNEQQQLLLRCQEQQKLIQALKEQLDEKNQHLLELQEEGKIRQITLQQTKEELEISTLEYQKVSRRMEQLNKQMTYLEQQVTNKTTETKDFVQYHGEKVQTIAAQLDEKDAIVSSLKNQLVQTMNDAAHQVHTLQTELQNQTQVLNDLKMQQPDAIQLLITQLEEKDAGSADLTKQIYQTQQQANGRIKKLQEQHSKDMKPLHTQIEQLKQQLQNFKQETQETLEASAEELSFNESMLEEVKFQHSKEVELLSVHMSDKNNTIAEMARQMREAESRANRTIQKLQDRVAKQGEELAKQEIQYHALLKETNELRLSHQEFRSMQEQNKRTNAEREELQLKLRQIKRQKDIIARELVQVKLDSDDAEVTSRGINYLQMENDTLARQNQSLEHWLNSVRKSEAFLLQEKDETMANMTRLSMRLAESKERIDNLQMQLDEERDNRHAATAVATTEATAVTTDSNRHSRSGASIGSGTKRPLSPGSVRSIRLISEESDPSAGGSKRSSRIRSFITKRITRSDSTEGVTSPGRSSGRQEEQQVPLSSDC